MFIHLFIKPTLRALKYQVPRHGAGNTRKQKNRSALQSSEPVRKSDTHSYIPWTLRRPKLMQNSEVQHYEERYKSVSGGERRELRTFLHGDTRDWYGELDSGHQTKMKRGGEWILKWQREAHKGLLRQLLAPPRAPRQAVGRDPTKMSDSISPWSRISSSSVSHLE